MKTVTKTINVFEYKELSSEAKEKAKQDYLTFESECGILTDHFNYCVKEIMQDNFPLSELDYRYSFSYTQNDGFKFVGRFNLFDILHLIKQYFTDNEYKELEYYITNYHEFADIVTSYLSLYMFNGTWDFVSKLIVYMEYNNELNIDYLLLDKFNAEATNRLIRIVNEIERLGYQIFYPEYDDDYMQEISEVNDWYYEENGKLFGGF